MATDEISAMRRRLMAVVVAAWVVAMVGCSDDDDSATGTFHVQADAAFCTDLLSARDTVISGVVDPTGRVSHAGVATFAGAYEAILRDHIEALRSLDATDPDAAHVTAVVDAATEVADRLHAVASDPTTASVSTTQDLRALATSPTRVDRLTAAGATTLREDPGHHVVMADPEGNEFCVC